MGRGRYMKGEGKQTGCCVKIREQARRIWNLRDCKLREERGIGKEVKRK